MAKRKGKNRKAKMSEVERDLRSARADCRRVGAEARTERERRMWMALGRRSAGSEFLAEMRLAAARLTLDGAVPRRGQERLVPLADRLSARAPKLLSPDWARPIAALCVVADWARDLDEWRPRGKSPRMIFRSLVDHLLCRFPVPHWTYSLLAQARSSTSVIPWPPPMHIVTRP